MALPGLFEVFQSRRRSIQDCNVVAELNSCFLAELSHLIFRRNLD